MHKTILEAPLDKPTMEFHTHILSDIPEDSDVFYAMSMKAQQGEWILTTKFAYSVKTDGSIHYMGQTDDFIRGLRGNAFPEIVAPYRAMMLATLGRLIGPTPSTVPLEAFATYEGARCSEGTLWIKLSIVVHNTTEMTILLYKDPSRMPKVVLLRRRNNYRTTNMKRPFLQRSRKWILRMRVRSSGAGAGNGL